MSSQVKVYMHCLLIVFLTVVVYSVSFTYSTANKVQSDLTYEEEMFKVEYSENKKPSIVVEDKRVSETSDDSKTNIKQKLQTTPYVLTPKKISTINKHPVGYTYFEVKFNDIGKDTITSRDVATYINDNKLKVVVGSFLQSGILFNFITYYITLILLLTSLLWITYKVVPKIRVKLMHGKKANKIMEAASRYLLKKGINVSVIVFYTTIIVGLLTLQNVGMVFDVKWQLSIYLLYTLSIVIIVCFEVYRIDRKSKQIED